jgi:hypothetical protein
MVSAVDGAETVPGTGTALRRKLMRSGCRLALTAGFACVGWILCGTLASTASAAQAPNTNSVNSTDTVATSTATSDSAATYGSAQNSNNGLLGGLLGNTVNSVLGTVNSTLTTVGATLTTVVSDVNTVGSSVLTPILQPVVAPVTSTVAPIVAPIVSTPPTAPSTQPIDESSQSTTQALDLAATPTPTTIALPVNASADSAQSKATRHTAKTTTSDRTDPGSKAAAPTIPQPRLPLPQTPQPAPQPIAPGPTMSAGHGPGSGSRHAINGATARSSTGALTLLSTVVGHPIVVPGEMPGLPSVSPD